jgi:hypothetical protein
LNACTSSLAESSAISEVVTLVASSVLKDLTFLSLARNKVALLSAAESSNGLATELVSTALFTEILSLRLLFLDEVVERHVL